MASCQCLAEHDYPEIERRFVGIGRTMIEEGEEVASCKGLVSNAEVSQFIGRGKVSHQHLWNEADDREQKDCKQRMLGEKIIFHRISFL